MARKTLGATAMLRSICALFAIVCILFFILPHAHDCAGEDCPLCVLKEICEEIIPVVCFFGLLPIFVCFIGNFTYFLAQSVPQTLVHQKVKLSD